MAKKKKNLSNHNYKTSFDFSQKRIAVITAEWNENITFALREGCCEILNEFKIKEDQIKNVTVPGAFELPTAAKMMLQNGKWDAVICIGCVITGETKHDEYISHAVATGIMQLGILSGKPIIFGVLTPKSMEQAIDRAGGAHGNKGHEAAITALKMIEIGHTAAQKEAKIGF